MNAHTLPTCSIVAEAARVWIKRSNGHTQPEGSPFHETWWIEATTYAVQVPDDYIQRRLDSGDAQVLRVGGTRSTG